MARAIYFCENRENVERVYRGEAGQALQRAFGVDGVYARSDLGRVDFHSVEAIFSTWGMSRLCIEEIKEYFPDLKALFYAAGSVQNFAREFLAAGVRVFSAWQANAVPVAEYTVAQILLANKGFYQLARRTKSDYRAAEAFFQRYRGNYDAKVGILGDGAIGGEVIRRLKDYRLDVMVYSITMDEARAREAGVTLASLPRIFEECDVISNHLANNAQTVKILNGALFSRMKPYSTFLNTGRGAQVDEDALIAKLKEDDTVTAVLDVTDPEPPERESPFNTLDNVILTPHIAGSAGLEVRRMAQYMAEESARFFSGALCRYEVTQAMLETMA